MTTPAPGDGFGPPVPPADGQFDQPGQQPAAPYGAPAPGYPTPPAPPGPKNVGGAIAAGFGAMLAGAILYGFVMKTTDHEIGWVVFGLAFLVALALGKIGGNHPMLPVLGAVFSVGGLFLGQFFGASLYLHQLVGAPFGEMYGSHIDVTFQAWKAVLGAMDIVFYAIAVLQGFLLTKRYGLTR